ncbi:MAG: tetratricopeptide repeat protein [Pseudomonadota bacterium]
MRITCPGCSAEFNVDDGRIPPLGTTVRCPKCFKAVDVKPQSEARSLDTALLGDAAPLDDDPFSSEFTQPEAELPPAALSADTPVGPGAGAAGGRRPTPNTVHYGLPGDGIVDNVWASGSEGKPKGTALGMPPLDPEATDAAGGGRGSESIFDADLSWSEERPAGPESAPAEPAAVRVSGLEETAIAESPDIEDLEQALAALEASSGVVSGGDGDPVAAEPLPPLDGDALAEGFDMLDEALVPREDAGPSAQERSFHADAGFAPLDQVGDDGGFEIQRDTISQDGISQEDIGLPSRDGPPKTFEGSGPTIDDIDFDSLLDDLPGDDSGGDTFFVDRPEGGDGGGAPAFDGPKGGSDSPFDMEEINFDNLDEFSDLGELSDTGTVASGTSAASAVDAMELDMGDELPSSHRGGQIPVPSEKPGTTAHAEAQAPRRRRPKKRSAMPLVALVVVLGLGAVGMFLFGDGLMQLLSGEDTPDQQNQTGPATKQESHQRGSMEYATRTDYERRVETLDTEIELGKGNKTGLESELLWVLAWYRFSYPGAFPDGAPRTQRAAALRKQYAAEGTVFAKKLEAMDLAAAGNWTQAKSTFSEYMKLRNSRQDELWQSDQQAMKAMIQEDYLLDAWLLVETKDPGKAREKLQIFLKKQPTSLFGLYLDALILYKETEQARSEAALGKVLDKYPTHVASKILLTDIEIEQGKFDQAVAHGRDLVKAAVGQQDETLETRAYRIIVQALTLKGKEGSEELKEVLEGVVAKRANAEEMVVALSRIYLAGGGQERALTTLTMCKECTGKEYLLLLVTAMQRNEMLERALQTAQAALEKNKNNIDLLILMSEISEQTGRHNSAMDYLRDVLRLRPDHLDGSMRLAKLFLELKQPANAREILLETEKYNEDNLQLEELLVEINLQMNDDSGAASALRKVHKLKLDDIDVRLRLVEILVRLGNYKEAVPHFDVLAEKNLITAKLRPGYAMALREVGRMDDALEMLEAVLRDDPSDYQTARNLATIYLGKNDYFKAREYLEMARRSRSKDPEVHHLIGTCCLKTEDWECALLSYTEAVELEPTNLLYRTEYAKVLYHLSETDSTRQQTLHRMALSQFNEIIRRYETDPSIPAASKDPDIYANRGRISFALGYYDKALEDFRQAVSMDQHRVDLLLAMGDSLFHVNKRSDAKKYYREVLDTGQNLAHANFYLGKIHMVEGDAKKAKAYFLAAIDADFKMFPDAHRYLGNIYKEAKFRDMAFKYYRNYLGLVPPNTPQARDIRNTIERMR